MRDKMNWIVLDVIVFNGRCVDVTREPNGMARPLSMGPHIYKSEAEAEAVAKTYGAVAVPYGVAFAAHKLNETDIAAAESFLRIEAGQGERSAIRESIEGRLCE